MPPDAVRSVTDHGAVADGSAVTTGAIQATIDEIGAAGGGVAVVPPGEYASGTLELADGVTLHVETGATLRASPDRGDYARDELTADFFSDVDASEGWHDAIAPLLVAEDASEIGLTGGGRIDGRGEAFWTVVEGPDGKRFDPDDRPGMLIRFTDCAGVRVRDVRVENSPGWTLHLRGCADVSVHDLRIRNSVYGPNTDGIDVDACRNVRISDSTIVAGGDDAIVLKNVRKGLRTYPEEPSRNITVTNCELVSRTNGFKIGTENYEGFEDVALSNAVIRSPVPGVDYAVDDRFGVESGAYGGVSIETVDGATVDGVAVSNVIMRGVQAPIFLRVGNRPRYRRDHPVLPDVEALEPGTLRNVSISNVVATGARMPSPIAGLPGGRIENVSIANVRVETAGGESDPAIPDRAVPEMADAYPEADQWGTLPASGFYCRHVDGLTLRNVSLSVAGEDVRPAMGFDDVTDLSLDGVRADPPASGEPLVALTDVRRALLRGLLAPGVETAVGVDGKRSRHVMVTASNLAGTTDPIRIGKDVPGDAVEWS